MKRIVLLLQLVALIVLVASSSQARVMSLLNYDQLFEQADLVVIAQPSSKTTDTKEKAEFPDLIEQHPDGGRSRVYAVGVETTFAVSKVMKGDPAIARFVLHHYREANTDPSIIVLGGPAVVSFDPDDPLRRRDFILFLIREPDGRFAPVGGQTDPGYRAILSLGPP